MCMSLSFTSVDDSELTLFISRFGPGIGPASSLSNVRLFLTGFSGLRNVDVLCGDFLPGDFLPGVFFPGDCLPGDFFPGVNGLKFSLFSIDLCDLPACLFNSSPYILSL